MTEDYLADQYHSLNLLTFNVGVCQFATKIDYIEQIILLGDIRKIPNTPKFIEGVFELQKKIVIVIDLRKIFRLRSTATEDIKVIICKIEGSLIGFIVDDVSQVVRKIESEIESSPPPVIHGINPDCIYGMLHEDEQHIMLINLDKILNSKETKIVSQVSPQKPA